MELINYKSKVYPTKIDQFLHDKSIREICTNIENELNVRNEIMFIASKYLSLNVKAKVINNDNALIILVDYLIDDCGNLEMQEIDYIFRNGVLGKFGKIFNDMSIDVVFGWIETYYSEFRKLRPEPVIKLPEIEKTGKEISHAEWMKKYGDYKLRASKYELSFEELYYHMDETIYLNVGCKSMKEYLECEKEYEPLKEIQGGYRLKRQRLEKILQYSEVEYVRRCLNEVLAVKSVASVFSKADIFNFRDKRK